VLTNGLQKYFDEHGLKVLTYEHQLRELWLDVLKTEVGKLLPPGASGGVLSLYDLQFRKTGERFSNDLVEFLKGTIELSDTEIARLEEKALVIS
jgi:hypothetical protein